MTLFEIDREEMSYDRSIPAQEKQKPVSGGVFPGTDTCDSGRKPGSLLRTKSTPRAPAPYRQLCRLAQLIYCIAQGNGATG